MAAASATRLGFHTVRITRLIVASRLIPFHRGALKPDQTKIVVLPIRASSSASFSTSAPSTLPRVYHDDQMSEFRMALEPDGEKNAAQRISKLEDTAYLKYERVDENTVDLYSTFVPPQFEGQGAAARLAEAAFSFCLENNLKMRLSCSYLAHFVKKSQNSKYAKLVVA